MKEEILLENLVMVIPVQIKKDGETFDFADLITALEKSFIKADKTFRAEVFYSKETNNYRFVAYYDR